jgi:hypothetical protein
VHLLSILRYEHDLVLAVPFRVVQAFALVHPVSPFICLAAHDWQFLRWTPYLRKVKLLRAPRQSRGFSLSQRENRENPMHLTNVRLQNEILLCKTVNRVAHLRTGRWLTVQCHRHLQ